MRAEAMNVTEAYQHILSAAEERYKRGRFSDRKLMSALRIFRRRVFRMNARLEAVRARLAKNRQRPKCLR
ncbi:hypothetical protein AYO49_05475 [Verrucomicrobiaceae bacterium SCGC AG-212-N21]|nr:hypothetical protein AYO49_05475 [Verrucomicrobiaceae bacterium SCGC AG-212-N21]